MKACSIEGCGQVHASKGYCKTHYMRLWRYGDPNRERVYVDNSGTCKADGCDQKRYSKEYCRLHYGRLQDHGTLERGPGRKPKYETYDSNGYRQLYKPEHPRAQHNGYVREHLLVMEEKLGRPLAQKETVHHKNGVRWDNRPENLELWASFHTPGQRVEDLKAYAAEIISRYGMPEMEMQF